MTIKRYAETPRPTNMQTEDAELMIGLHRPPPAHVPQFEHLGHILQTRDRGIQVNPTNKFAQEIFLIDDGVENLKRLIQLIKDTDTFSVKVGILLRIMSHTTSLCIEKISSSDPAEEEITCVYHIDSVVMDIDQGPAIRQVITEISTICTVYSLGYDETNREIVRDCKRQSDSYSCISFSLYDVESMLEMDDFYLFAQDNSETKDGRIYTLRTLPPKFMAIMQSIHGQEDGGEIVRSGLQQLVETRDDSNKEFILNDEAITLRKLYSQLVTNDIPNPIADMCNDKFYKQYEEVYHERDPINDYLCPNLEEETDRQRIADRIYKIAQQRHAWLEALRGSRESSRESDISLDSISEAVPVSAAAESPAAAESQLLIEEKRMQSLLFRQ